MVERDEPRKGRDGKWVMWHVIESPEDGVGGQWPTGEVTLRTVSAALSELYSQRESQANMLADIDKSIAFMEEVKNAIYADAVSTGPPAP